MSINDSSLHFSFFASFTPWLPLFCLHCLLSPFNKHCHLLSFSPPLPTALITHRLFLSYIATSLLYCLLHYFFPSLPSFSFKQTLPPSHLFFFFASCTHYLLHCLYLWFIASFSHLLHLLLFLSFIVSIFSSSLVPAFFLYLLLSLLPFLFFICK